MAHCVTELSQLNAYLPLEKFPIYGNLGGKFFSSLPGAFNSVHTTFFADVISFFCWVLFRLSILPILLIGLTNFAIWCTRRICWLSILYKVDVLSPGIIFMATKSIVQLCIFLLSLQCRQEWFWILFDDLRYLLAAQESY